MQILLPVSLLSIIGCLEFSKNRKDRNLYFILMCMLFAIVAFSYQPHLGDDLYRDYEDLNKIREIGWSYFSTQKDRYGGLYITQLYYYFFANLPIYNFLPAVTAFLGYYFSFKLLRKVAYEFGLSAINVWYVFAYIICVRETYMIFSNIRNQLAFVIFAYYLYVDLVEKRKRTQCFAMYVMVILIHQSAAILLVFRLICFIPFKRIKQVICLFMLFWSNELTWIFIFLKAFANSPFINNLLYKLSIYTVLDSYGGNENNLVVTPLYEKFIISNIPILLLILVSIYICYKHSTGKEIKPLIRSGGGKLLFNKSSLVRPTVDNYLTYALLVTCFTIGSNAYYWIYLRFSVMVQIVGIIVVAYTLKLYFDRKASNKKYIILLFIASELRWE